MFLDQLKRIFTLSMPVDRKMTLAQKEVERIGVAEEVLERQRLITLHKRYEGMVDEKESKSTWLSDEEIIDLSVARTNKLIWDRPGKGFYITHFYGQQDNTKIRFNSVAAPFYRVNRGYIKTDFDKIYLTNTAQTPGHTLQFVVSSRDKTEFGLEATYGIQSVYFDAHNSMQYLEFLKLNSLRPPTTPKSYNVTMTLADTEYSQVIASISKACRELRFGLADGAAFRYAWVTGKVATPTAPYIYVPANTPVVFHNVALYAPTLYFADDVGTKVMQIDSIEDG